MWTKFVPLCKITSLLIVQLQFRNKTWSFFLFKVNTFRCSSQVSFEGKFSSNLKLHYSKFIKLLKSLSLVVH